MIFDYVLNSTNVSEKIDTHEDSIIGIQSDISKCVSLVMHQKYFIQDMIKCMPVRNKKS